MRHNGRMALLFLCGLSGCARRAVPSGDGAVAADVGTGADVMLVPDLPGWACAGATGVGQVIHGSVDIIWFIDSSNSMTEETTWVQQNLNSFASYIAGQQLDYRVILIGKSDICVPPPLGGDNCTDGARYMHVKKTISSHDGLEQIISTYPQWQRFLRADATKNFVAVTDDNSEVTAAWFNAELAQLTAPGINSYYFHSIVAYGSVAEIGCDTGAAIGQVYLDLTSQTGGVKFQVCQQDWVGVFNSLAEHVTSTSKPPCSYLIPDPGEGKTVNPDQIVFGLYQSGTANELGRVASQNACGASGGWYYDDASKPTTLILCPVTCSSISGATIKIAWGCQLPDAGVADATAN